MDESSAQVISPSSALITTCSALSAGAQVGPEKIMPFSFFLKIGAVVVVAKNLLTYQKNFEVFQVTVRNKVGKLCAKFHH